MKKFIALLFAGVLMSGCATILDGRSQVLTVSSNVDGAEVILVTSSGSETVIGKTPYVGPVKRIKNGKLAVKKDGFKTIEIALTTDTNPYAFANLLSIYFSTTGTSTDYSTGALYKYAPESYMANLEPKTVASKQQFQKESSMRIFALLNYDRICGDIAFGKGEYLNSIYEMYGAKNDADRSNILSFVKNVQANADSIPVFANALASRI